MIKQYEYVDPDVTRQEMAKVLIKGLGRSLTEQEIRTIYWLGDIEYKSRGIILDLFKELNERIEYFKED
ncbi:hypothetical protein [Bacillus sp. FJAT-29937]|uniref:hypothetical protein n=1 Tax=Bacillus sp. FJAT-29937 TaxID=1720553 RepID=UPI0008370964|nr:hypothetical protein [Bacillus sp. FJAT-29937]